MFAFKFKNLNVKSSTRQTLLLLARPVYNHLYNKSLGGLKCIINKMQQKRSEQTQYVK